MKGYNTVAAREKIIKTGAWLARDMDFDPACPPTERQVENWRRETMWLIQNAKKANSLVESQDNRIAELESALRHVLIGRDKYRIEALMRGKPSTRATIESVLEKE